MAGILPPAGCWLTKEEVDVMELDDWVCSVNDMNWKWRNVCPVTVSYIWFIISTQINPVSPLAGSSVPFPLAELFAGGCLKSRRQVKERIPYNAPLFQWPQLLSRIDSPIGDWNSVGQLEVSFNGSLQVVNDEPVLLDDEVHVCVQWGSNARLHALSDFDCALDSLSVNCGLLDKL